MFLDLRLDQIATVRLHLRQGTFLIGPHQPAVAGDIGRQNGAEPSVDPIARQGALAIPSYAVGLRMDLKT